ncbi:hypothetical protein JCM3775_000321 [Rhodotorula graminis]|uniref:F-box domain-containing protein n=1 Tax=Rhodotorula graminis (strain WP1) TaxID=578459 RepID=A0A0P9GGI4_RHOGW|nr:uncharacterized protein RHOBADRAFT_56120 [Rhodotorula graminis WP1]KPV71977.1 hypothetical protein RHOBADRAFT_56120 [Rhodotorula graminis WP1]
MATQHDQVVSSAAPQAPATAAARPTATPLALRLPDELWLLILAEVDYCALKQAQMICKKVQRLIQDKRLDAQLFRLGPVDGKLEVGMSFELHPHVERLDPVARARWLLVLAKEARKRRPWRYTPWSYPALDDYITSPACTRLKVRVAPTMLYGDDENEHTFVVLERRDGVTVFDVFKALGEWYDTRAPRYVTDAAGYGDLAEKRGTDNEEMVRYFFFEHWSELVVRAGEGAQSGMSVYLEATMYTD